MQLLEMHRVEMRMDEGATRIASGLWVPASHPSLPGHFPGSPVVPGVLLLSVVLEQLETKLGGFVTHRVRTVKFLRPLSPGERFDLDAAEAPEGRVRFMCQSAAGVVAQGVLEITR